MKDAGANVRLVHLGEQEVTPATRERPGAMVTPTWTGDDMDQNTPAPSWYSAEAKIFAEAAMRMLEAGETAQASLLLSRAAAFARLA